MQTILVKPDVKGLYDSRPNGTRYLKFPLNALAGAAWEAMHEMMMMPATWSIV